ncbi:hypothetical protein AAF712_002562 [Marasmius tenuissimus]|uniref:F-box domain-containing protein n=1 Tax=Marasmius tenuissimus TaxID=585030 RepID=A0ABR3A8R1_9AGAR
MPSLHSNQADIRQFLTEIELDLSAYDDKIADLEGQLMALRESRNALRQRKSRFSSLLAPIRRLQSELLQEIFIYTVAGSKQDSGNTFGIYSIWRSSTLFLSFVCSRWRNIVLDTPALWSAFGFEISTRAGVPVELFLTRSRGRPLSVEITSGSDHSAMETLRSLLDDSGRIAWLDYHNVSQVDYLRMLERVLCFPTLKDTVFRTRLFRDSPTAFSDSVPLLDTLVCRYEKTRRLPIPSLPLNRIRSLVFQWGCSGSLSNMFDMLRDPDLRTTLQSLAFESLPDHTRLGYVSQSDHSGWRELEDSPAELPNLEELTLVLYHHSGVYPHIDDIVSNLTLPSLTKLYLIGDCDWDGAFDREWPRASVDSFLSRSRSAGVLTSVVFDGLPITDVNVIAFLQHTPSLEFLTLNELFAKNYYRDHLNGEELGLGQAVESVSRLFVDTLNTRFYPSRSPFLPKVRSLCFRVHKHFDADAEFVDMVKSRWYPPRAERGSLAHATLREVTLAVLNRNLDEELYEPLKLLEEEGLRVVVAGNGQIVV